MAKEGEKAMSEISKEVKVPVHNDVIQSMNRDLDYLRMEGNVLHVGQGLVPNMRVSIR